MCVYNDYKHVTGITYEYGSVWGVGILEYILFIICSVDTFPPTKVNFNYIFASLFTNNIIRAWN